ncbi:MAG TPA: hypothetical protein VF226_13640 [Hyphomicrobiaceae bacterium]
MLTPRIYPRGSAASTQEIDAIAERAAQKALQIVYAEVGKSVLRKAAWLAGAVVIGLAMWLAGKGHFPGAGS